MVFLPNLGVNRRVCLCDVASYVSAQTLDFLDLGQKSSFLDLETLLSARTDFNRFMDGHYIDSLTIREDICKRNLFQTIPEYPSW